jgi:hypothetical protein
MCMTLLQQQQPQQLQQQVMMRQWRLAVMHLRQQGRGLGALIKRLKSCNKIKPLKEWQLRMQQRGVKRQGMLLLLVEGWQGLQHAVVAAWRQMAMMQHLLQVHSSQAQR